MSSTPVWKDIDISMNKNIYNDVGILTDVNAVTNALINRVTIDASEMPFYNRDKTAIQQYLHSIIDFFTEDDMIALIKKEARKDSRIIKINNVKVEENPNDYNVEIKCDVVIDLRQPKDADLTIYLKKE